MWALRAQGCKSLQKLPDLSSLSSDCLYVNLSSCSELFRRGVKMTDVSLLERLPKMKKVDIRLIGGEMPEWFLHCKEDSISFMAPRDLYDKYLGLALCVVLGVEEGKVVDVSCDIQIVVNGQTMVWEMTSFDSLESGYVWLKYFPRRLPWEVEKHMRDERRQFQVSFRPRGASIKECGFRLICGQQEDDMRVVPQHHQPIENKLERDSEEDNSYCRGAKAVLKELNQIPHLVEHNERDDGWKIQDALSPRIGRRTVPQVFKNGQHIGGSDDTVEAYESGELSKLLGIDGKEEDEL